MMDWSDRHCRRFWRVMSRRARLYTEMVTTGALIYGDRARFLRFSPEELPLALQLGGHEPSALAECARMAEDWGYSEVNLNVGCPSDRVQEGRIGACLMAEPEQVADCVAAMSAACGLPITLKHRLGIDDWVIDERLGQFMTLNYQAGCRVFIVHARNAWLKGLSPKENREVPPLDYDAVHELKRQLPDCQIVLNGGLADLADALPRLTDTPERPGLDGIMLGRAAYQNPFVLASVDSTLFNEADPQSDRLAVIEALLPYIEQQLSQGVRLHAITRHLLGLFAGQPGGRQFPRHLSEQASKPGADLSVLLEALACVQDTRPAPLDPA